ncbi:MAG: DUF2264 domain-containing protein [Terrimonas sp.]|nr:DUF2264 domain-containing protein [Terrimonas sp.]
MKAQESGRDWTFLPPSRLQPFEITTGQTELFWLPRDKTNQDNHQWGSQFKSEQPEKYRENEDRFLWLQYMDKIARPVLLNLANDQLKLAMPVMVSKKADNPAGRKEVAPLEALGRLFSGLAPWINADGGADEEIKLRDQYRNWSVKAIANAVDPSAKDYMQWTGGQPLVDASFLALGLIRAPWVWDHLPEAARQNLVAAFLLTRGTLAHYNNWILFAAMIETFFYKYGLPYDGARIDFAVNEFARHWYTGDGMFSDGMQFHLDYYNSFVIQPYLSAILENMDPQNHRYDFFLSPFKKIRERYAVLQERLINADGSFPVLGRSITYRGGVFHHLADMSYRKSLPDGILPSQVRSALTAVLRKTLDGVSVFDKNGWLAIGLSGSQPSLGEGYITTGSLYLCAEIFLPLGLPDTDPFWSAPAAPWTSVKAWNGEDIPADHAMEIDF